MPLLDLKPGRYVVARYNGLLGDMTAAYHYLLYTWPARTGFSVDLALPPFERFVLRPSRATGPRIASIDIYVPIV